MTVEQYFVQYQDCHHNAQNKLCHYIGIPLIVYALLNLLHQIPSPLEIAGWPIDWALLVALAVLAFYLTLSAPLTLGMVLGLAPLYVLAAYSPWPVGLVAFAVGWAFQFLGHHVEGRKPAFLANGLHLLIGPLWIVSHVLEKLHLWAPRGAEVVR